MAVFPTLPAPLINTFQESAADNLIRTSMDKNVDKVRRKSTAAIRPIQYSMILTSSQLATLLTFYNTTTNSGADEFTYTHPRTAATETARFTAPISFTDINGLVFTVSIALELLP